MGKIIPFIYIEFTQNHFTHWTSEKSQTLPMGHGFHRFVGQLHPIGWTPPFLMFDDHDMAMIFMTIIPLQ